MERRSDRSKKIKENYESIIIDKKNICTISERKEVKEKGIYSLIIEGLFPIKNKIYSEIKITFEIENYKLPESSSHTCNIEIEKSSKEKQFLSNKRTRTMKDKIKNVKKINNNVKISEDKNIIILNKSEIFKGTDRSKLIIANKNVHILTNRNILIDKSIFSEKMLFNLIPVKNKNKKANEVCDDDENKTHKKLKVNNYNPCSPSNDIIMNPINTPDHNKKYSRSDSFLSNNNNSNILNNSNTSNNRMITIDNVCKKMTDMSINKDKDQSLNLILSNYDSNLQKSSLELINLDEEDSKEVSLEKNEKSNLNGNNETKNEQAQNKNNNNNSNIYGNGNGSFLTYTEQVYLMDVMNNKNNIFKEDEIIASFDFKSAQGRDSTLQIFYDDYRTLNQSIYLNDKIIMFLLKFMQAELTSEEIKGKFVILDTYFYQKLSCNKEYGMINSPLVNYNSVKKWTKNIPMFKTDFIIIPINEDLHWSLIIICYPGRIEKCFTGNKNPKEINSPNNTLSANELVSLFPSIIYLDSFYENNNKCINIFKKYLFYEYAIKNNIFDQDDKILKVIENNHCFINVYVPKVPKQPNTYDCGIYLLIYAELFLFEPTFILNKMSEGCREISNWFTIEIVTSKREVYQQLIYDLGNKNKEEVNAVVQNYYQNRNDLLTQFYKVLNTPVNNMLSYMNESSCSNSS